MRRRRGGRTLRWLILVALLLTGVSALERHGLLPRGTLHELTVGLLGREAPHHRRSKVADAPPVRPAIRPDGRIDYGRVRADLATIRVAPEKRAGYAREEWPHWLDPDGNCLDAREEALIRDSVTRAKLSDKGCAVVGGKWRDPYTGETETDPAKLDIDHRVPLEEAYASGGYDWPRDKRAAYANDLSDPLTLVVVTAAANRAKGSRGPEEWLPPRADAICPYVADWIAVKARWKLTMDERERVTVGNILADCQGPGVPSK